MNLKEEMNDFIENQEDFYLNSKQNDNLLEMEMDIYINDKEDKKEVKKMFSKSSESNNGKLDGDYDNIKKNKNKKLEHFI